MPVRRGARNGGHWPKRMNENESDEKPTPSDRETFSSSLASLLSCATDEERSQIEAIMRDLSPPETIAAERPSGRICKTMAEASVALGVTTATLNKWQQHDDFPGKRGARGGAYASYPVDEILRWRAEKFGAARGGAADTTADARRRKQQAEAALKELELERRAGNLIDSEQAESIYVGTVSTARSLLEELSDVIAAAIPPTKPKLRRKMSSVARRHVRRVLDALAAEQIEAQREESEQEGD